MYLHFIKLQRNMSFYRLENKLHRSKSTGALDVLDTNCVNSKIVNFIDNYCSNDRQDSGALPVTLEKLLDSFNNSHRQIMELKQNNLKLKGMLKQHQNILNFIKEDRNISYRHIIAKFVQGSMKTIEDMGHNLKAKNNTEVPQNQQAEILLAAIEPKRSQAEVEMIDALAKFENKYQKNNDIQKDNTMIDLNTNLLVTSISSAQPPEVACDSSKHMINNNDRCEKESSREWCNFRESMDLKLLRRCHVIMDSSKLNPLSLESEYLYAEELKVTASLPQPADPEVSKIDHLMQSAVINKKISEGDFNGSFEEALSHCNLALVMGACRAIDPAQVFNPCYLTQSVLLSLVQQLATDMVHETQLKCRYLEEALINLDVSDRVTRAHLPLVVGEVRKHLSKFVLAYPHHVAIRRISLIIMAADNLIE